MDSVEPPESAKLMNQSPVSGLGVGEIGELGGPSEGLEGFGW